MNIYDIARLSGVSIATVSRVMNGSDKVSGKTRRKVLSVIQQEGYTPNLLAQGLGQGTMHAIGIMAGVGGSDQKEGVNLPGEQSSRAGFLFVLRETAAGENIIVAVRKKQGFEIRNAA